MTQPAKLTIPDVIEKFRAYHQKPGNGAWGLLHVVLDDGNIKDCFVQGCIDDIKKYHPEDTEALELAEILLKLSKTQRLVISAQA